ncbi:hypothetical protein AA0472_2564 [Acetobacter estunensis NRIC 0472]|uniref:Uncharacterized protein n=1 Tax=Acetobacter estunensis TaxID=104097 RepID=A0A967BB62_9PROT|nr:hypothetical protein [Acetobacter estunensis]NHO55336.1 hypothetical protein [Acetobacter estunensis]GBQ28015.1 hypothetical protein AA0472_2564 [Acetobacter estunensis NRIC 0472]
MTTRQKYQPLNSEDIFTIRDTIARFDPSASSTIVGADKAKLRDIFAPMSHSKALDPATTLVLGARGAGKSFWASVLYNPDTRHLAAELYPRLGIDRLRVEIGFGGVGRAGVSKEVIDKLVPEEQEKATAGLFWKAVIAGAALTVIEPNQKHPPREMLDRFSDPQDWADTMVKVDDKLEKSGETLLIVFDALDAISEDWKRLSRIIDALLASVWSLRGFNAIRAKLFMRSDQLSELTLRFVELSKLRSGAARLGWRQADLYGLMFARLAFDEDGGEAFGRLLEANGLGKVPKKQEELRTWKLSSNESQQEKLFVAMAGYFMGAGPRKGKTFDWPYNHLADGLGDVTPRSFLILMQNAAERSQSRDASTLILLPQTIRDGLRAASKVRIEQLNTEYPWIKRVLQPLAGLRVPAEPQVLFDAWAENATVEAAIKIAQREHALPPVLTGSSQKPDLSTQESKLADRLIMMGVLTSRPDERYDMPDLFRIGAALLKKGGVPPKA